MKGGKPGLTMSYSQVANDRAIEGVDSSDSLLPFIERAVVSRDSLDV
jgi:hypothetical protein